MATRKWRNFIKIEYGMTWHAHIHSPNTARKRAQESVSKCDCEHAKNSRYVTHVFNRINLIKLWPFTFEKPPSPSSPSSWSSKWKCVYILSSFEYRSTIKRCDIVFVVFLFGFSLLCNETRKRAICPTLAFSSPSSFMLWLFLGALQLNGIVHACTSFDIHFCVFFYSLCCCSRFCNCYCHSRHHRHHRFCCSCCSPENLWKLADQLRIISGNLPRLTCVCLCGMAHTEYKHTSRFSLKHKRWNLIVSVYVSLSHSLSVLAICQSHFVFCVPAVLHTCCKNIRYGELHVCLKTVLV